MNAGFDLNKLPLEQLTEETLRNGYIYLKKIEDLIKAKTKPSDPRFGENSAKFYTYIPHNFGRVKMSNFIITTDQDLQKKMDLVSDLIDIKTAYSVKSKKTKAKKLVKVGSKIELPNPIDEDFEKLNCKMDLLKATDSEHKMLTEYISNSKSS